MLNLPIACERANYSCESACMPKIPQWQWHDSPDPSKGINKDKGDSMALSLSQIKDQFEVGESEGALLGKLQAISKETFALRKDQSGSAIPRATHTRKYLGSKGSKVVLHVDPRSGKVYGVATTAESL
jgi:hypothetical protein